MHARQNLACESWGSTDFARCLLPSSYHPHSEVPLHGSSPSRAASYPRFDITIVVGGVESGLRVTSTAPKQTDDPVVRAPTSITVLNSARSVAPSERHLQQDSSIREWKPNESKKDSCANRVVAARSDDTLHRSSLYGSRLSCVRTQSACIDMVY